MRKREYLRGGRCHKAPSVHDQLDGVRASSLTSDDRKMITRRSKNDPRGVGKWHRGIITRTEASRNTFLWCAGSPDWVWSCGFGRSSPISVSQEIQSVLSCVIRVHRGPPGLDSTLPSNSVQFPELSSRNSISKLQFIPGSTLGAGKTLQEQSSLADAGSERTTKRKSP